MASIADELIHTTVRIETMNAQGVMGSGTGFIVHLCKLGEQSVPVVITNWHVVEGAVWSAFHMTIAGDDGLPKFGAHKQVRLPETDSVWVRHPNPHTDLAAFPLCPCYQSSRRPGDDTLLSGFR